MNERDATSAAAVFEAKRERGMTYGEIAEWSTSQAWGPVNRGEAAALFRGAARAVLREVRDPS